MGCMVLGVLGVRRYWATLCINCRKELFGVTSLVFFVRLPSMYLFDAVTSPQSGLESGTFLENF